MFITPFQAIRRVPELRPLAGFRVNSLDCKALADHEPRMYQDRVSWRSFIFEIVLTHQRTGRAPRPFDNTGGYGNG